MGNVRNASNEHNAHLWCFTSEAGTGGGREEGIWGGVVGTATRYLCGTSTVSLSVGGGVTEGICSYGWLQNLTLPQYNFIFSCYDREWPCSTIIDFADIIFCLRTIQWLLGLRDMPNVLKSRSTSPSKECKVHVSGDNWQVHRFDCNAPLFILQDGTLV